MGKKKGGAGKRKGSAFERTVCNKLSKLVAPDSEDTIFWRSAMSGGRATVQNKKGGKNKSQLGDITCIHKEGHWLTDTFVIECKFYAKLDIEAFFLSGKGKLYKFWRELRKICRKNDRLPMLIAKQNRTPVLLILTERAYKKLVALGFIGLFAFARVQTTPTLVSYICFFDDLKH